MSELRDSPPAVPVALMPVLHCERSIDWPAMMSKLCLPRSKTYCKVLSNDRLELMYSLWPMLYELLEEVTLIEYGFDS